MAIIKQDMKAIEEAYARISHHVRRTPLEHSLLLSNIHKANVYLKLECEQVTGSFKVRGAYNKILYSESTKSKPKLRYVTASSGNHGVGCSLVLKQLGMKCTVYSSQLILPGKEDNLKLYGAEVVKHGIDCVEAEIAARNYAEENDGIYISPYADYHIICGQGTIGVEILKDLPNVDAVFVTVGGGGLISGIGLYLKCMRPDITIIGCSPINSNVMEQSVKAGRIVEVESLDTLSDGSAGGVEEGSITFGYCQQVVDRWVSVEESEIADAMYFIMDKHHKIIEGAAGVALASFLKVSKEFEGKNIAIVLCGANVDTSVIKTIINNH